MVHEIGLPLAGFIFEVVKYVSEISLIIKYVFIYLIFVFKKL